MLSSSCSGYSPRQRQSKADDEGKQGLHLSIHRPAAAAALAAAAHYGFSQVEAVALDGVEGVLQPCFLLIRNVGGLTLQAGRAQFEAPRRDPRACGSGMQLRHVPS